MRILLSKFHKKTICQLNKDSGIDKIEIEFLMIADF